MPGGGVRRGDVRWGTFGASARHGGMEAFGASAFDVKQWDAGTPDAEVPGAELPSAGRSA